MPDDALVSPPVARNRDPILDVLRRVLPASGTVLEIASGTGEHAVHFAAALPGLAWQPTDVEPDALRSIVAYRASAGLANLSVPIELDVRRLPWPVERADAIVSINMIHIAPWTAAEALMDGSGRVLAPGGLLFLYGPFLENGREPAPGNVAFDQWLQERDPDWGIRRLDRVLSLAGRHGLQLRERVEMPANNLSLVLTREESP